MAVNLCANELLYVKQLTSSSYFNIVIDLVVT